MGQKWTKMAQKRPKGTSRPRPAGRARTRRTPSLRGNALATIDERGRLKLPAGFRRVVETNYGGELFLTSARGDSMWLYPLSVWEEKERRLLTAPSRPPAVTRFLERVNYFGAEAELDGQGRVLVPPVLRKSARIDGEVAVLGALDHLDVWNNQVFQERLAREPFSDDDQQVLAELGC